jgi:hypothetical protein
MSENNERKEWVTIKVPEETRNEAREDRRTYEQIMRDGLRDGGTDENADGIDYEKLAKRVAGELEEQQE